MSAPATDESPILYVRIGGIVWVLQADGVMRPLADGEPVNGEIVQAPEALTTGNGSASSNTSLAQFFAQVGRTGAELLAKSGFQTFQFPVDLPDSGTQAGSAPVDAIDPSATITVVIEDGGDGYLNRFESPVADIHGTTTNVRDGTPLTITVTDSLGASLTFQTTVTGNSYHLDDQDLSSLTEGPLVVKAVLEDRYGTHIEAVTDTIKDTIAEITAEFVDETVSEGHAGYYNAAEFPLVTLQGTVSNVEDGQSVHVIVTDSAGNIVNAGTAIISAGAWQLVDVDLGSLQPGNLTIAAEVIDVPGNPAVVQSDPFIYDPTAGIDIDTGTGDGLDIVALKNGTLTSISGSTTDVEAGQTVTLSLSDGTNTVEFTGTTGSDGSWTVSSIDISGLDADAAWTLSTSVTDFAGNTATDDSPTLVLPDRVLLSDLLAEALPTSYSVSTQLNIQNASEIHFSATQTGLADILSEGQAVTVSNDGQIITVTRADNEVVLLITLDSSGQGAVFQQMQPVDQPVGGPLQLDVSVVATQTDADGTTETVTAPVHVTIYDSVPIARDDSATVTEAETDGNPGANANLLANDFILEGDISVVSINVAGTDYAVSAGSPAVVTVAQGTLTVNADGTWSFAASRNFDNSAGAVTLPFTYTIEDVDGDFSTADVTLSIVDGEAGVVNGNPALDALTEADLPGSVSHGAAFTVSAGSDDLDADTIRFDNTGNAQLDALDALNLTSNGEPLVWSLSSDGKTLTATDGTVTVLTIVVSATAAGASGDLDGTVTTTLSRPLDHTSSDNLALALNIIATDNDGTDATPGSFTLTLNDGTNPVLTPDTGINLDENDLLTPTDISTASGTFTVDLGSDGIARVSFAAITGQPALSNGGVALSYSLSADGQTLTASVDHGSGPQTVFIATLTGSVNAESNSTLAYSVELHLPLDNGGADPLSFDLAIETEDIDGDITPSTLTINVAEDALATIDIDTGTGVDAGLDIVALKAGTLTSISGTTQYVEPGQTVTLTLSDGSNTVSFTTTLSGTEFAGTWTVTGIDISTLDPTQEWTLNASVTDVAGNSATDDTPTLVLPTSITLSESDLAANGNESGNGALNIQNADEVHFAATQTGLSGLSSENSAITFTVAADGQSITGVRASDGATVLTLTLNADQSITTELFHPLDQADGNGTNSLAFDVLVVATQTDADSTTESVTAPITIVVEDTTPLLVDDTGSITETQSSSGNLLSNDTPYELPYTLTQITVNSTDYAVSAGTPAVVTLPEGTLTVSADGNWSFSANRNVDNSSGDYDLVFSYTAEDADGDLVNADVTLSIVDGDAGVVNGNPALDTLTEADLPGSVSQGAAFTVSAGSDDLDATSIRFDNTGNAQLDALTALNLTSNGEPLVWSLSSDGKTLTATDGTVTVLTIVVSAAAAAGISGDLDGTVTTTLSRPLDHNSSDSLALALSIIATDNDGTDAAPGSFTLTLNDGTNPVLTPDQTVTLSEDNLTAAGVTTSGSGSFELDPGSDAIAKVAFAAITGQPALTSGGESVVYSLSPDGQVLTGTVDHGSGPQTVIVVTLTGTVNGESNSTLGYDVTLHLPIDNGSDDPLAIPFAVEATDVDGDVTTTTLVVNIAEDSLATIDIDTGTGADAGLDIVALKAGTLTSISGTTQYVEPGQTVTLTLTDEDGTTASFTTTVQGTEFAGTWTVSGIDVSTLDPTQEWTLNASVTDVAGNSATDDTPTLVLPTSITLSESDLAANGNESGNGALNIQNADEVHFAATQTGLSGLSSENSAITFTVAADGQSITGVRASDGATVLTLTLNADQSITTELFHPLDQADGNGTNSLAFDVLVVATQTDADSTTESVTAPITIVVEDTTPLLVDDTGSITETQSSSGNLLSNDTPYETPYTLTQITVNSTDYAVSAGTPAVVTLPEGTLTVSADGNWSFSANRNVDNSSGDYDLVFSYTAEDADGDLVNANVTLSIVDGDAGVVNGNPALDALTEADLPGSVSHGAAFTVSAGSDDLDADTIRFDNTGNAQLDALDALNLTSNGEPLVWSLSSDGKTLTATDGTVTVLTIVVSATAAGASGDLDGTVTTTLSRPLDHNSSDSLALALNIIATDNDGTDATPGSFTLTLNDGSNPVLTPDTGITLDENDLLTPTDISTASGTFTVDPGSDGIARVSFAAITGQPALTSGGDALSYSLSADGQTLTASVDHGSGPQTVFIATLTGTLNGESNSTLAYSVELHLPLDNGGNDPLSFDLAIETEDVDGDITPSTLTINVAEDALATIDIDTGTGPDAGLDIVALKAGTLTSISGTTQYVEPGQTVTLTLTDEDGTTAVFTTTLGGTEFAGTWTVSGIDVSTLNAAQEWTLNASVTDVAGNSATDDTPTIILPGTMVLSEAGVALFGHSDGSAALNIENADAAHFTVAQTALSALTSESSAVAVTVASDGQSLTVTRNSDGETVLTATLNADQSVSVSLQQPVDQAPGRDTLIVNLQVAATQNDADGTSETVLAPVYVGIKDTAPFALDDSGTITEATSNTGNLLVNDKPLEAPYTVQSIKVAGADYAVSAGSPATVALAEGTLKVDAQGQWTFTANRNNDNSAGAVTVSFSYTARDADGDVDSADVTLSIVDGASGRVVNNSTLDSVTENTLPDSVTHAGSFVVTAGSDDLDAASIRFDNTGNSQITALTSLNLTSNGIALQWSLSGDGKTLTATDGTVTVLTLVVSASSASGSSGNLDGLVTTTLLRPLDHLNSADTLVLPLFATATDNDGTVAQTGKLDLSLLDGALQSITIDSGVDLQEDNLSTPATPVTGTGTLTLEAGSDDLVAFGFADIGRQPALSSGGEALVYSLSPDGLVLTAKTAGGDTILEVTLNGTLNPETPSSFSYTVNLYGPLDELGSNGSHLDPLSIPLVVQATDRDNDIVRQTLDILVEDSTLPPPLSPDTLDVSETPVTPVSIAAGLSAQDQITVTITAGKDPVVAISFSSVNGSAVLDANGNALTQNGQALVWDNSGEVLTARCNGVAVFTLIMPEISTLPPEDSTNVVISMNMLGPVDHLSGDVLNLLVPIQTLDSDASVASTNVSINISDGRNPVLYDATLPATDESPLITQATVSGNGSLDKIFGSDTAVSTHFALTTTVTSHGLAVALGSSPEQGWWVARDTNGQEVFRIKIDANGTVSFQQSEAVDHAPGNGANSLNIDFSLYVTDADGDNSNTVTVTVPVTDALPQGQSFSNEIVEGASLSGNFLSNPVSTGADGGKITSFVYAGTTYTFVDDATPVTVDLEYLGEKYGELTLKADGSYTLDSTQAFNLGGDATDSFTFTVTDADGDTADSVATLDIRDADGFITIAPITTPEDTSVPVSFSINLGDLDQGEHVDRISFDASRLAGGTLYLDGVALPLDGGNPYLDESQLSMNGSLVTVNGTLTFVPALNTSQATDAPVLDVTATIAVDSGPDRSISNEQPIVVTSVADAPSWDAAAEFSYNTQEDAAPVALTISANLFDTDGSEQLTYRIDNIESGLVLKSGGSVVSNGMLLTGAQLAALTASAAAGDAGLFTFDVTAIATEQDNGDSESITQQVSVAVQPVADTPILSGLTVNGLEDQDILLRDLVNAQLVDKDSSETLSYEIDVPTGWEVIAINGAVVGNPVPGTYTAQAADVDAGNVLLRPLADISSVSNGGAAFAVDIRAVATESTQDGLAPTPETASSATVTAHVHLTGVIDEPLIEPGSWSYDSTTHVISASFAEDSLVPLDFFVSDGDDDGSEALTALIVGLPDGVQLVDGSGNPVALTIAGVEGGKPVYQVDAATAATLHLKLTQDFAGSLDDFILRVITTEPDGDSASFEYTVRTDVLPLVDTADGQNIVSEVTEDKSQIVQMMPVLGDIDGSETVTAMVITAVPDGTLYVDNAAVTVGPGGLDVTALATAAGISLQQYLQSGRISWSPSEDASGDFFLPIRYEITDTASTGTDVQSFTGTLELHVNAQVDIGPEDLPGLTRLDVQGSGEFSSDGEAIDLSGAVIFTEDDIDGSEIIDYIVIRLPEADGWAVVGGGAINDGNGNWLLPVTSHGSTGAVDVIDVLAGISIVSDHATGPTEILVQARVLDGDDAEMVSATLTVEFTDGVAGSAQAVSDVQDTLIEGEEAQPVDIGSHLNSNPAGDGNDVVSYRVDAADLPAGSALSGPGVQALHDLSGKNVIAWVFENSALPGLTLTGVDEDRSGVIDIPLNKISTDPQGDTVVTVETLNIELAPVVDAVTNPDGVSIIEDVPSAFSFDVSNLLNDSSTDASQGLEAVTGVVFTIPAEGTISGPPGLLLDNGSGGLVLTDVSRLGEVYYTPPLHKDGQFSIEVQLTVTDSVTGNTTVTSVDTATVNGSLVFTVIADADAPTVTTTDVTGNEDSDIALAGVNVQLVDQDGSETLSVEIRGVPTDAVLFYNNGGTLVQAENTGPDGGSFNGEPTYGWQVPADQMANLVLRPPENFSGDIPLSIGAVTVESSNSDYATAGGNFVVHVNPVADGVQFTSAPENYSGREGDVFSIDIGAQTLEAPYVIDGHPRDGNESIVLTVKVLASASDTSALIGLNGIAVGGVSQRFQLVGGSLQASITVPASMLAGGNLLQSFDLLSGPLAYGNLQLEISAASVDSAVVDGVTVSDSSAAEVRTVNVTLEPAPDAPLLTSDYDSLQTVASNASLALGLHAVALNAAAGEVSEVVIAGVPSGFTLNHGSQDGAQWVVAAADVGDLALQNNGNTVTSFELSIQARSTLDGETVSGTTQLIAVTYLDDSNTTFTGTAGNDWLHGGNGNDTLTGLAGADTFAFQLADIGSTATPATDIITDFAVSEDRIDISSLVAGVAHDSGADLDVVLDLVQAGANTEITVDLTGSGVTETIVLQDVSLNDLYGADASGVSTADILQKMLDDHTLQVSHT